MPALSRLRFLVHQGARKLFAMLPQTKRHSVYRSFVNCDPEPNKRLVLKIADTREELEACFKLLHDAYVSSGFMTPDPSGMRVTIYHALPTTTTLCAKFDGQVVGTLSLIRESAIGFPLQRIFDLSGVRAKEGNIAEVSALAVHPRFRRTGGSILFPLMKFMYEYCTTFFDTRHLVIAVNPRHIEMYESLLFFRRLTSNVVENYDFVNGAPAVGRCHAGPPPGPGNPAQGLRRQAAAPQPLSLLQGDDAAEHRDSASPLLYHQRSGTDAGPDRLLLQPAHPRLRRAKRTQENPAAPDLRPAGIPRRAAAPA